MTVIGHRLSVGLAVLAILVAACSGSDDEDEFPLDEMPTQSQPSADATDDDAAAGEDGPTDPELPQECSAIVAYSDVVDAIAAPMSGGVSPIYQDGGFHEDSGRLQRLTCSYGGPLDDEPADDEDADEVPPVLQIAVSSYVDGEHARDRVSDTVDSANDVEPLDVNGMPGYVLRSDESATYVAADGILTYVISLQRGVVESNAEDVVLITLAEHLIGALEPTPTPTD